MKVQNLCCTMPFTFLCLVLALAFATESLAAKTTLGEDFFAKFDGDYEVTSEKDEIEGFEYALRNFTFPALSEGDSHDRVKRLQAPGSGGNLCIMTFNIRVYVSPRDGRPQDKDRVIAQVSFAC